MTQSAASQLPVQTEQKRKVYTITDKVIQSRQNQIKQHELSNMNQKYFETFRDTKYPEWATNEKQKLSWAQYKSSLGKFLETIEKDAVIVKNIDFENFVASLGVTNENTIRNKIAHVKSFLSFLVKNNISNCNSRVSREALILIVCN